MSARCNLKWSEVDNFITESRMNQFKDCHTAPRQFTFHRNHLFFLAVPKDDMDSSTLLVNTLQYIDLGALSENHCGNGNADSNESSPAMDVDDEHNMNNLDSRLSSYKWKTLLTFDPKLSMDESGNPNYSKEEQLLRERKRMSAHGITSYEFHHQSGRILFAAGNSLYWLDVNDVIEKNSKHAIAHEIPTNLSGSRMDAKICHRNPNLISFIYSGDIWVANISTNQELRLTFARSPGRDDCMSAGVPSYVTEEEFDRFTGYWWEPEKGCCCDSDEVEVHRILFEMVDESMVNKHHIVTTTTNYSTQVDTYRYPRAGSKNAQSSLRLVQFSILKKSKEILDGSIFEHELRLDLNNLIPWFEYIVRCEWMADGQSVWAQLLNRRQNRLAVIRIPTDVFRIISSNRTKTIESHSKIEIILEEICDTWINLSDIIHFLPATNTKTTKLIWSSEKFGHRHLFLYTVADDPSRGIKDSGVLQKFKGNGLYICDTLSCAQLTEGSWDVSTSKIWVDEGNQLVYFNGRKETPLEEHLYVTSYQFSSDVKRLTEPGLSHVTQIDTGCDWLVTISTSLKTVSQVNVSRISHEYKALADVSSVKLMPLGWLEVPREIKSELSAEFFCYTNSRGFDIHGLILKRKDLDPDKKHPAVLFVYGGPGIQLVTNSQKALRRSGLHSIASFGFIAIMIDTMGSYNRGLEFEAVLKDSMGTVEIEEQVEGLQYIANTSQCIDMQRIAIHGWSYGGYLSLMGLAQRPDIFKISIAGAPVVSWELYDTGYTERYMNLPENNKEGYKKGSVLEYIKRFPDEQNRLLIVHGLIDENVHFSHTDLLINHLINEGKPYNIQIFPNERHGIRHASSAQHYETSILMFLQLNL